MIAALSKLDQDWMNAFGLVALSFSFVSYYVAGEKKLYLEANAYPVFRNAEKGLCWQELVFPVLLFAAIVLVLYLDNAISFHAEISDLHYQSMLLTFGAAALEEVFFRGYLLAGLRRYLRLEIAVLIAAALFSLAHYSADKPAWLYVGYFTFAIAMAAVTIKYRSLLFAIIFHFIFNYAVGVSEDYFADAYNGQGLFQFHDRPASILYAQVFIALHLGLIFWCARDYYAAKLRQIDQSSKEFSA
ncbi:CPBP family intramembrane glutamic endopeptidase [Undibacterium sp. Di27W]|uniref:CPBP family intramembrane glutamic endopeptidase n=1 Tax=Undibacterium sp. Di27W TaxID=3413036 RepID=UPI003BF25F8B